jgi:cobalt-zinc-cadmium efflux system outer membrane protein
MRRKPGAGAGRRQAGTRVFWILMTLSVASALSGQAVLPSHSPLGAQEAYTLQDLLQLGREGNPSLLALRAQEAASMANRRDAGRFQNPEFEYEWGEGESFEGGGEKTLSEFSFRQTIDNPISRHYRLGALNEEAQAASEDVRFGALGVDYEIRQHFFRILSLGEFVRLAQLNEQALAEVRDLIELRARVGEVRDLEAIRLRVEHMRAQNEVQGAELELDQFRKHLNMFLGHALPGDFRLEGELASDLQVPDFEGLVEALLPQHPLLQRADRYRKAADRSVKASQFGWFPSPTLSATSAQELDGDIFKLGIGLQIPLWNFSRAAVERERQTLRQTEHEQEGVRLEIEAALMIHHNHLLMHQRTLQLFQEGLLEEAEMSMQIAEISYREGEISLIEYLDARRTYQSIQIEYHQALFDWNRELAELERAAGGGIL